jgi:hypothetical protein
MYKLSKPGCPDARRPAIHQQTPDGCTSDAGCTTELALAFTVDSLQCGDDDWSGSTDAEGAARFPVNLALRRHVYFRVHSRRVNRPASHPRCNPALPVAAAAASCRVQSRHGHTGVLKRPLSSVRPHISPPGSRCYTVNCQT